MKTTHTFARIVIASLLSACMMSAYSAQVETPYMTAARYNPAGQITGTIAPDPDGPSGSLRLLATRNTYTNGLLTKTESGELGIWQDESTDPNSWAGFTIFSTTVISYDTVGRKIQETMIGRNGSTVESLVEYSYDSASHLQCKAVRLSKTAAGNACAQGAQSSDGPDRIYRYTYDGLDQVLTEERGVGTSLQETYVTNTYAGRRIASQTDASGNRTELRYEPVYARMQYRVFPSPTATGTVNESDYNQYSYDGNGNVLTERKRNGTVITNQYDANNRLTTKALSDHTYAQDVSYDYDARGLMLSSIYIGSGLGITTHYDGFGNVQDTRNTMGGVTRTLSYQYDNNGNRTRVTHPDGYFFQYGFDGLNRINALNESTAANSGASTSSLLTVGYRPEGIPFYISRNGATSVTSIPLINGLDNANRVQNLFHDFPGTTNDLTNTFTYNAANQITQLTQSNTAYSYTGNDNKTGAYAPDGLNRYTTINGQAISYDLNQNLTSDGTNTYTYDMENHLVATTGGVTSSFTYDPKGRLFQSIINGTTTQFLYDGDALVGEYVLSGGIYIQSRRYVHGDQVDQPLVQYVGATVSPAARIYLHADHQGSIIAESDNSGNVQAKFSYDNFGVPKSSNFDRFGYTGQIYFKELALNYYKARWYSPAQGRFMQTDPIFYKDDMDLYTYVGNDPMDKEDPSGNCSTCYEIDSDSMDMAMGRMSREAYDKRMEMRAIGATAPLAIAATPACAAGCAAVTTGLRALATRATVIAMLKGGSEIITNQAEKSGIEAVKETAEHVATMEKIETIEEYAGKSSEFLFDKIKGAFAVLFGIHSQSTSSSNQATSSQGSGGSSGAAGGANNGGTTNPSDLGMSGGNVHICSGMGAESSGASSACK